MSVLKCKHCGQDIEINSGDSTCECPSCKAIQTQPEPNNEKKITLYNLANKLRLLKEYDQAKKIYSTLASKFDEVEAYFGLVLTKYGVYYEDDNVLSNICAEIPVFEDEDYMYACSIATDEQLNILENEAKLIEKARVELMDLASTKKSYEITILVNDENRKSDGYLVAKEMYEILGAEGKKVFFPTHALKNLENRDLEAQLYKGLKSSKMLILFAKSIEKLSEKKLTYYLNKYLDIMDLDDNHMFVPCLENISEEDIPQRIKGFRIIDLSKDSFIDEIMDLVDNAFKPKELTKEEKLVKKAKSLLKENDFVQSMKYVDAAIKTNKDLKDSYLVGLMASLNITDEKMILECDTPLFLNKYYQLALDNNINVLEEYNTKICDNLYEKAILLPHESLDEINKYVDALKLLNGYKDSNELIQEAYDPIYKDTYDDALSKYERGINEHYELYINEAIRILKTIPDYKDSKEKIVLMEEAISKMKDDMCKVPYDTGIELFKNASTIEDFKKAQQQFMKVLSYKDSKVWNSRCKDKMYEISLKLSESSDTADLILARDTFKFLYPYKDSLYYYEQTAMKAESERKRKK